jgi:hypothetical protein
LESVAPVRIALLQINTQSDLMGGTAAAAAQLQEFLQHIAHRAASSRNDGAAAAANCKQHSTRQAILQAIQAADNSIDVLLQVIDPLS